MKGLIDSRNYYAVATVNVDWSSKAIAEIISQFHVPSLASHFLPPRALLAASLNRDSDKFNYLVFLQNPKLARLAVILHPWATKWIGRPYSVYRDTIILAESVSLLREELVFIKYAKDQGISVLQNDDWHSRSAVNMDLFIDNKKSQLLQVVKFCRDKYFFDLLNCAESLSSLEGNLDLDMVDKAGVSFRWNLLPGADLEAVSNDIYFVKQFIYRLCKANNIFYAEKISVDQESADLAFEFSGMEGMKKKWLKK